MHNVCCCNGKFLCMWIFFLWVILMFVVTNCSHHHHNHKAIYGHHRQRTTGNPSTGKICFSVDNTLRARRKSCFLRPDTGPCRADIVQWYFDVKQNRCYRFFWGGCQGNGNRFESKTECKNFCFLNSTSVRTDVPYFCSLAFEYGDCFGYFHRWAWDKLAKTCKRYVYSGCGGNQNNFHTNIECMNTCVSLPNNTLQQSLHQHTTCMPINIPDLQ